jgi:hypothetical protein
MNGVAMIGNLPTPPVDATVSDVVEANVITVMAGLTGVALVFAVVFWWRTKQPTVLMLILAGGSMMLLEPFVDVVGGCWHPSDLARVFTLWERPMPVWLCLTYFVFFGIGGGLTWLVVRRGATPRTLWLLFLGGLVGDVVLETVLMHWDVYRYYGNQPLVFLKFPLWWAPVNSVVDVVTAVAIVRFAAHLRGARQVLIIPLAMAISAAANTVAGLPSWTAVNSPDLGPVTRDALGLASFVVAGVIVWLLAAGATGTGPRATSAPDDRALLEASR